MTQKRDIFVIPEDGAHYPTRATCRLKELQTLVRGYIEIVNLAPEVIRTIERDFHLDFMMYAPEGSRIVLVVNDDWQRNGCVFNPIASLLAGQTLHGPAVICALD